MTKLSERLRDWKDKWLEDAKREAIEAADLLDECERTLSGLLSELTPYHFKQPFNHAHAVDVLARLRKEQADE